jgi:hypothetical protein
VAERHVEQGPGAATLTFEPMTAWPPPIAPRIGRPSIGMHAGAAMLHLAGDTDERDPCRTTPPDRRAFHKLRHQAFAERRARPRTTRADLDPATGERVADDADADRAHDRPRRLMSELGINDLAQCHDLADVRHPLLPS